MIASPMLSNGDFNFLGTLTGKNGNHVDNVNVIAWDCDDKSEIKPLIKRLLSEAKDKEQTDNLKENVVALKEYLQEINAGTYEHDLPKGLESVLIEQVRCSYGPKAVEELRDGAERFMYLSGVDVRTL